jgi:hypothetical protein
LVASALAPSGEPSPALDQYGGYRDLPVPGGATGFFRTQKVGDRWLFVTPEGHALWLRAVYGIDITDGGDAYVEALKRKYNSPSSIPWWPFAQRSAGRLKQWGFNALGEYSSAYAFPVGTYGRREFNLERLPYLRIISPSHYSKQWSGVKNIQYGVDRAVTPGLWRVEGFPDVFDPAFAAALPTFVREAQVYPDFSVLTKSAWLIGTTTDDRDYLFGFGPTRELGGWHHHLGWISATTAPSQQKNDEIWRGVNRGVTYQDTKVYTKYAVRDFLRAKYGTVQALNAAWGSRYTTWDSDGGWPSGQGVLDESGRNAWVGKDFYSLKDSAPKVRADLDEFVGVIADQYFKTVSRAIRNAMPNHLIFTPAALSSRAHPKVLEAAGRYCDVLQIEGPGDTDDLYRRVYALAKKPFFIWTTFMSQADSPLAGRKGWGSLDFPTQAARGQAYADFVQRVLSMRADDGTYPIVGIDWWAWSDKVTGGEGHNFGLVSIRDNAYDGREAVMASGQDAAGYPTGGEKANYGDFLSRVVRANESVGNMLRTGFARDVGAKASETGKR